MTRPADAFDMDEASTALALLSEGIEHHAAGRFAQAVTRYSRAVEIAPGCGPAWRMLGVAAFESGEGDAAAGLLQRAIRIDACDAAAHYSLGLVRSAQNDLAGAIAAYESAVAAAPHFAAAHGNLGNAYRAAGRRGDALRAYADAIAAQPHVAMFYANCATVLIELERYDEAIATLESAREVAPESADVHAILGHAYRRSGRLVEAIAATRRALELRPDSRDDHLNLALAAYAGGDYAAALAANRRALDIDPGCAQAHANSAAVYYALGRLADAVAACDAALTRRPEYAEAHVTRAAALLAGGEFARGWADYAWLWRLPQQRQAYPYFDRATLWNGEAFAGRELLITREQGFGDAIFVARYLPAVKARGGRVVFEAAAALAPLLAGSSGIDELRVTPDVFIPRDDVALFIPLMGLPGALGATLETIPAAPYLAAPAERIARWRPRLDAPARLRVGIVWAGNPALERDRGRSCRLEDFALLGAIDGIVWYSLQKGAGEEQRSCGPLTLVPLGPRIDDFADSAAIVTQLDLVIAVDTAIVHLAGAVGTPVWTLLPFASDWRWLRERDDSPWYPTMRLFRQPRPGDWAAVFARVAGELAAAARSERLP